MINAQAVALADRPPGTETPPPDAAVPGAPRWMTMQETADYLGKTYSNLLQHWRKWGLTSYKIGRERKFRQDEVDTWLLGRAEGDGPPEHTASA